MMRGARALAVLLTLAGCVVQPPYGYAPYSPEVAAAPTVSVLPQTATPCRIGPQGGPPGAASSTPGKAVAAAAIPAPYQVAERGIGGTGSGTAPLPPLVPDAPARPTAPVDRGVGGTGTGTGIVGVITGFASICVNGLEVGYGPDTTVVTESGNASIDSLRVGQLALIEATGTPGGLHARRVVLRYEVVGPVDTVNGDGTLSVAGQLVRPTAQLRGAPAVAGAWVAVSGLRDNDGTIAATRIDPAAPDLVGVHGMLVHDGDGVHIGALLLHVPRSLEMPPDGAVTASGRALQGVLYVERLVPDLLQDDPSTAFGPQTSRFVVETLAGVGFGSGLGYGGGTLVVQLRRGAEGGLRSVSAVRAPFDYAPPARPAAGSRSGPHRGARWNDAPMARSPVRQGYGPSQGGRPDWRGNGPGRGPFKRPGGGGPPPPGH